MYLRKINGPRAVELPNGTHLSRADLPPANTRRWVASRKALVIKAVASGLMEREEALERYALSDEEFDEWCRMAGKHGQNGLKTTAIQKFR